MPVLEALRPIFSILPEVPKPKRTVSFREKLLWTTIVLTIYLVFTEVPLYPLAKVSNAQNYNPLFSIIFATRFGTLAHLGVGPIVTAGLIMQLLVGSKIINLDLTDKSHRALFTGTQKFLAIVFTLFESIVFIASGLLPVSNLAQAVLIILQLFFVGIIIILMDELLQKGWGFGSGISLFILTGVALQVFSSLFSPIAVAPDQFFGLIPNIILVASGGGNFWYLLLGNPNFASSPSILGLISMIVVLILLVYLQSVKVEIPVAYPKYGGVKAKIPLQLLYVSNVPVILAAALVANLLFVTQLIWSRYNINGTNPILSALGYFKYVQSGTSSTPVPAGGLIYYLTPPQNFYQAMLDPVRAIVYVIIFSLLCILFSYAWVETSGMNAEEQAKKMVSSGLQVPGFRQSNLVMASILKRYIPTLTWFSGLLVGLLASVSDIFGVIGTGIGLLLAIGIIYQYYMILVQQRLEEEFPSIARFLEGK
jgi:preprotein translocase, SecY subunit